MGINGIRGMVTFGEVLRDLRRKTGKSQTEVARELIERYPVRRFSQTTLSELERQEKAPRGEILEALGDYYGVPPVYFYARREEEQKSAENIFRAKVYLRSLKLANFDSTNLYRLARIEAPIENLGNPSLGEIDDYLLDTDIF